MVAGTSSPHPRLRAGNFFPTGSPSPHRFLEGTCADAAADVVGAAAAVGSRERMPLPPWGAVRGRRRCYCHGEPRVDAAAAMGAARGRGRRCYRGEPRTNA
jgi:hypothetical protein